MEINSTQRMLSKMGTADSSKTLGVKEEKRPSDSLSAPLKDASMAELLAMCLTRKDSFDHTP